MVPALPGWRQLCTTVPCRNRYRLQCVMRRELHFAMTRVSSSSKTWLLVSLDGCLRAVGQIHGSHALAAELLRVRQPALESPHHSMASALLRIGPPICGQPIETDVWGPPRRGAAAVLPNPRPLARSGRKGPLHRALGLRPNRELGVQPSYWTTRNELCRPPKSLALWRLAHMRDARGP